MKFKTNMIVFIYVFISVEKKQKNVGNHTVSVDFHYMDKNTTEVNENQISVLIIVPPKTCRQITYMFNQSMLLKNSQTPDEMISMTVLLYSCINVFVRFASVIPKALELV